MHLPNLPCSIGVAIHLLSGNRRDAATTYYYTLFEVTLTIRSQVVCFSGQVILKRCCAIPMPAPPSLLFFVNRQLSLAFYLILPIPLSPSPDASPSDSESLTYGPRGFFHGDIRTNHRIPFRLPDPTSSLLELE